MKREIMLKIAGVIFAIVSIILFIFSAKLILGIYNIVQMQPDYMVLKIFLRIIGVLFSSSYCLLSGLISLAIFIDDDDLYDDTDLI